MDYKKAVTTLISLLDRHPLNNDEKEAVKAAIGMLSWASLSKSRIQTLRAKRDKSIQWQ